ncbi:MAG: hypothetical protein M1832_002324 [Thelocarpon impressellum]|nr:MAG: hypothetical protein M1832_002324 [Thelocarpon impressellum]
MGQPVASALRAGAVLLLWAVTVRCQGPAAASPSNDTMYTYPYGGEVGRTIEYTSWSGGAEGASHGMTGDEDVDWKAGWMNDGFLFDENAQDVRRWLPPLDGAEFEIGLQNGPNDFTNVYNRSGSYAFTRLWLVDDFWTPACARMTAELQRLQSGGAGNGKVMQVVLKHYGGSFPDADNNNATVWTYMHAAVIGVGTSLLPTFSQHCTQWFGEIAAAGTEERPLHPNRDGTYNFTDYPIAEPAGGASPAKPQAVEGTAGGVRALQAADGSTFTLMIVPQWAGTS